MELALPPYKNSAKFKTGPPQHQNYSMFRIDFLPKQPRTESNFGIEEGASLGPCQICVEGGQVSYLTIKGGRVKKHPVFIL